MAAFTMLWECFEIMKEPGTLYEVGLCSDPDMTIVGHKWEEEEEPQADVEIGGDRIGLLKIHAFR